MVEVCGAPLLRTQVAVMRRCGVTDITVVGGYLAHRLETGGVTRLVNPEYGTSNMVWTLARAAQAVSDDVLVSYGDIIYPPEVLELMQRSPHDISVAVDLGWRAYWSERFDDILADAETLKMDEDGHLTEIGKKPGSLDEIQGQYIGLMRFCGAGADALRVLLSGLDDATPIEGRPARNAYMTDLLQAMIGQGHQVAAVPFAAPWCEVDSPEDLAIANRRACGWIAALCGEGAT
jgi:choline kinase